MLRREKRKEGRLETSDVLTIASLCQGFEAFSHRPIVHHRYRGSMLWVWIWVRRTPDGSCGFLHGE